MADKSISKVVFGSDTLIDLTSDTVTPETLGKGVTAHDKSGAQIVGTMEFSTIYTGSSAPDDSLGADGDIFVVVAAQ